MKYELTAELLTNNKIIDEQHKDLLDKINDFSNACMQGKGRTHTENALKYMLDYTHMHFKTEENLQVSNAYPFYEAHKAAHNALTDKFTSLGNKINTENVAISDVAEFNSLVAMLITHIKIEDKKLATFISEK